MKKNEWFNVLIIVGLFVGGLFVGSEYQRQQIAERWQFVEDVAIGWTEFESKNKEGLKHLEELNDEVNHLTYERDTWEKIAFENRAKNDGGFYIVYRDPNKVVK